MIIIDPCPTLKRFLDARAKGATAEELKALQLADEAARANDQTEPQSNVVVHLDRARIERRRRGDDGIF